MRLCGSQYVGIIRISALFLGFAVGVVFYSSLLWVMPS